MPLNMGAGLPCRRLCRPGEKQFLSALRLFEYSRGEYCNDDIFAKIAFILWQNRGLVY